MRRYIHRGKEARQEKEGKRQGAIVKMVEDENYQAHYGYDDDKDEF
jgi:hypothetical protein